MAMFLGLVASPLPAQTPPVHMMYPQGLPPGAIGAQQLQRGGPLPGYFQPVEIRAPQGVSISLAEQGRFTEPQPAPLKAGLLVGQVYRFSVVNIPLREGSEVFPTIEVINRLYAPRGREARFPIVIELTQEDLHLALDGKFVTRVIYLENPDAALPSRVPGQTQEWFEVAPGQDPLATADVLGRPMAIVRLGGRVPAQQEMPDAKFLFGCPPILHFVTPPAVQQPPQPAVAAPMAAQVSPGRTAR